MENAFFSCIFPEIILCGSRSVLKAVPIAAHGPFWSGMAARVSPRGCF